MEPGTSLGGRGLEVEPGDRTFPEATVVEQAWAVSLAWQECGVGGRGPGSERPTLGSLLGRGISQRAPPRATAIGGRNSPQVLRGWPPLLDVEVPTTQARSLEPGGRGSAWSLAVLQGRAPHRAGQPGLPEGHGDQNVLPWARATSNTPPWGLGCTWRRRLRGRPLASGACDNAGGPGTLA